MMMTYNEKARWFSKIYVALGFLIVLFPPKFHYKSYESKFDFFMSIQKVDFYFFMYEVISYLLIGLIVYLFFFKGKQGIISAEQTDKVLSEDEKENIVKTQSVQMLHEAVHSLVENVKCNVHKSKIVVMTIYLDMVSSLELTIEEEKSMHHILDEVIKNEDIFEAFVKYSDMYEAYRRQTMAGNKDNSQKLYALATMHALYLFRDKKEHELLVEISIITSYYNLIGNVAKAIKM